MPKPPWPSTDPCTSLAGTTEAPATILRQGMLPQACDSKSKVFPKELTSCILQLCKSEVWINVVADTTSTGARKRGEKSLPKKSQWKETG